MTLEVTQAVSAIASPLGVDSDSDVSAIAPLHTETISTTVEDSVTPLTESSSSVVPSDSLSTEPELPLFQAIGVLFGAIELSDASSDGVDGSHHSSFSIFCMDLLSAIAFLTISSFSILTDRFRVLHSPFSSFSSQQYAQYQSRS